MADLRFGLGWFGLENASSQDTADALQVKSVGSGSGTSK